MQNVLYDEYLKSNLKLRMFTCQKILHTHTHIHSISPVYTKFNIKNIKVCCRLGHKMELSTFTVSFQIENKYIKPPAFPNLMFYVSFKGRS